MASEDRKLARNLEFSAKKRTPPHVYFKIFAFFRKLICQYHKEIHNCFTLSKKLIMPAK